MFQTLHLSYLSFLPISAKESNLYHSMYHLFEKNDFWQAQKSGSLNLSKVETSLVFFTDVLLRAFLGTFFEKMPPFFCCQPPKQPLQMPLKKTPPPKKMPIFGHIYGLFKTHLKDPKLSPIIKGQFGVFKGRNRGIFRGALPKTPTNRCF